MGRVQLVLLAAAVVAYTATAARGQPATAEKLYADGQEYMKASNFERACAAFEGSWIAAENLTALYALAVCRDRREQFATAWGHYVEVRRMTRGARAGRDAEFHRLADARANEIEPLLSYVTIVVADDARVAGLVITRNGERVDPTLWNIPVPADGGVYEIEGSAPAFAPWHTSVRVEDTKDREVVVVPRFSPLVAPVTLPLARTVTPRPSMGRGRKVAIAALGVGALAAVGAAGVFEVGARDAYAQAKAASGDERRLLVDTANHRRTLAFVGTGVGVVAIGSGVALWLTGRRRVAPLVDGDRVGLVVGGRF